jgi:signal transduction histidine kinase
VNDGFNIAKLEKKIEKLENDINQFHNRDNDLTQTELKRKNIFLKEKLQTISDLVRILCHEMNQPLQAISGFSDLIKLNLTVNGSIQKDVDQICKQIKKANSINRKIAAVVKHIN